MIFKLAYIQLFTNRLFTLCVDLACVQNIAYNEDSAIIHCSSYQFEIKREGENALEFNKLLFAFENQYKQDAESFDAEKVGEVMTNVFGAFAGLQIGKTEAV